MWLEIWAVTIALAIGCVVMAQIIERQRCCAWELVCKLSRRSILEAAAVGGLFHCGTRNQRCCPNFVGNDSAASLLGVVMRGANSDCAHGGLGRPFLRPVLAGD
jgi:hypothetical protein